MKRNIYDYVMENENYKRVNCMHNFHPWNEDKVAKGTHIWSLLLNI